VAQLALEAAMAGNLLTLPLASQAATYSYTDLNGSGFGSSEAEGISGNRQVGYGYGSAIGNNYHALLWSGTASSVVDLSPNGFTESFGTGVSGGQQVGFGRGSVRDKAGFINTVDPLHIGSTRELSRRNGGS